MRAEIRPEGATYRRLCSTYLKAEWQLELGNLLNVVLIGTSGSRFPDGNACNPPSRPLEGGASAGFHCYGSLSTPPIADHAPLDDISARALILRAFEPAARMAMGVAAKQRPTSRGCSR